jgi:hypothetical protein
MFARSFPAGKRQRTCWIAEVIELEIWRVDAASHTVARAESFLQQTWDKLLYASVSAGMRDSWKFPCRGRRLLLSSFCWVSLQGARKQYPAGPRPCKVKRIARSGMLGFGRQCSMGALRIKNDLRQSDQMKPRASRRAFLSVLGRRGSWVGNWGGLHL